MIYNKEIYYIIPFLPILENRPTDPIDWTEKQ